MSVNAPKPMSDAERDALRIQAAAIAAQQAALVEREVHVAERERALAHQEEQIAAQLDEKRRLIESLQDQLSTARDQLRREREAVAQSHAEAVTLESEARKRRDRLIALHGRFVRRFQRHWSAERESCRRRQTDLDRKEKQLADAVQRLSGERATFESFRGRSLGATELEKRRLQGEWKLLNEEQEQQRQQRRAAEAELARQRHRLDEQLRTVTKAERRSLAEQQRFEKLCAALRTEAQGLENRISVLRRQLLQQERRRVLPALPPLAELPKLRLPDDLPALPAAVEAAFAARDEYQRKRQTDLEKHASVLADQRFHLAELYERLAQAEQDWEARQAESAAELEALAVRVQQQERVSQLARHETEAAAERLRQEREALQHRRRDLERGLADLNARQIMFQGERDRVRAEIDERERLADRRVQALTELFRRWRKRRDAEVGFVRTMMAERRTERVACVGQRDEYRRRTLALRQAQEAIADQALTLEVARQEFLAQTDRPEAATKRLERLRRKTEGQFNAARRLLAKHQAQIANDEKRLAEESVHLHALTLENTRGQRELAQDRTELEAQRHIADEQQHQWEKSRATWDQQRQDYERQLAQLRNEIERLARMLIDGGEMEIISAAA